MEVIKYSDVVRRVVSHAQRVYSELSNDDAEAISVYLDTRIKHIWEFYPWPDVVRVEKRYYRDLYASATVYAAGKEVYYPTEDKYYQALRQTNGQAPTDTSYWAESKQTYSGSTWESGTTYAVGDVVENEADGLFYAAHTAHTSSGTLTPTATGGNSRWGVLTEFDKYVAWAQTGENEIFDIIDVHNSNPRTDRKAFTCNFYQSENGIQVISGPNVVYVEYRQVVPNLLHKTWTNAATYKKEDVVRYPASGADFDLYKATGDHTAYATTGGGNTANYPGAAGAPWALIQIPRDFRSSLAHGAAADLLLADEREQLGGIQNSLADKALAELLNKIERLEQQTKQLNVVTK